MATADPFRVYLGVQRQYDAEVMRTLEQAARATRRRIIALGKSSRWSDGVRANQLRAVLAEIAADQRAMWRSIGKTINNGSKAGALSAQEALEDIARIAYASLPADAAADLVAGLRAQARAGINAAYARVPRDLAESVYKAGTVASGQIETLIRQGIIQGLSARELAASVYTFVSPTTPGGASYAAMRLARTEINNAFHQQQIAAAKAPGVQAVQWNLSGSHPKPDQCNVYAESDQHQLGGGVFPPSQVPAKPHPHCFCYLTYISVDPEVFARDLRAGKYDDELRRRYDMNMEKMRAEGRLGTVRTTTSTGVRVPGPTARTEAARKAATPTKAKPSPPVTLTPNQVKKAEARARYKATSQAERAVDPLASLDEVVAKGAAKEVQHVEVGFAERTGEFTAKEIAGLRRAVDAGTTRSEIVRLAGARDVKFTHRAGQDTFMDSAEGSDTMRAIGDTGIPVGTKVKVVKPGYVLRYGDEDVRIARSEVRRAD